jgi:hypothetical protein
MWLLAAGYWLVQKVVSAFPDLRCTIYSGSSDGNTSMTHSVCRGERL